MNQTFKLFARHRTDRWGSWNLYRWIRQL